VSRQRLSWRRRPRPADAAAVGRLCRATGFFNPAECAVARELVQERLAKGLASGYRFWFAEAGERLAGYACYGPVAGAAGSWELYWIAVSPGRQGGGLGRRLLARAAAGARRAGGRRLYAETSSRPQYAPTRGFYRARGFGLAATLPDFYGPGDHKLVYCLGLEA
jgi:ribosomal protein S18 acetylase RimI-like enzyme